MGRDEILIKTDLTSALCIDENSHNAIMQLSANCMAEAV